MRDLLSPREKRFLRRLAAGKTDAEIAVRLGGTVEQVSKQRVRLLARLQINSPDEIADAAKRLADWPRYRGIT
ncbi:DNA-binding CsgD family transcriptional regulator [Bradyrhizobium japonicum]